MGVSPSCAFVFVSACANVWREKKSGTAVDVIPLSLHQAFSALLDKIDSNK